MMLKQRHTTSAIDSATLNPPITALWKARSVRAVTHLLLASALVAGTPGCQTAPGPVFPKLKQAIVWPKPPDHPRIRYIGELTGESNLGAKPSGWEAIQSVFTGPEAKVSFSTPMAVAVQGDRAYVADGQLGAVHVLDLETRDFQSWTQAAGELLQWPIDVVTLDTNTIAVADSRRKAVFLLDNNGDTIRTIGTDTFERPVNLAWDPAAGHLWILDAARHTCFAFTRDGELVKRVGGRGADPPAMNYPAGLAFRAPHGLAVADSMNFRVQLWNADGSVRSAFGRKGDAAGDFALPRDVALDSEGHVYVLDNQFENVQVFNASGQLLMAFGREGQEPGEFYLPSGITIDARDRIWIADTYNRRVQVFQYLSENAP